MFLNDRDKFLNELKGNIGDESKLRMVEDLAENYKDKSEDEIFVEIIKLNKSMEEELSPEKYNEILGKLDAIRPMLSKEQNRKLDKVIDKLKKD